MAARKLPISICLVFFLSEVHAFRKKAADDATMQAEKLAVAAALQERLVDDYDDDTVTVEEVSAPVTLPMKLCFRPLVAGVCANLAGHGEESKPVRETLKDIFEADDDELDDFYAAMGVGGDTKCRDLCKLALKVAKAAKLIVPPSHDVGCIPSARGNTKWNCTVDLSPGRIAEEETEDMNDAALEEANEKDDVHIIDGPESSLIEADSDGLVVMRMTDKNHPTGSSHATSFLSLAVDAESQSITQNPERMAIKTLELFRIYVAHPDDGSNIIGAEDASSFLNVNGYTGSTPQEAILYAQVQARAWVSTVIAQLGASTAGDYRKKWFGSSGALTEAKVKQRITRSFNFMDKQLSTMHYVYPADDAQGNPGGQTNCEKGTLAYVWKWVKNGVKDGDYTETRGPRCATNADAMKKPCAISDEKGNYVTYLCKYWYDKFGEIARTSTFVHEAAHHTGPRDVSYKKDYIKTIAQDKQLHNAANYQNFGEDLTLGAWGCADADKVDGVSLTCNGGPCSCRPLRSYCNNDKYKAAIQRDCKATCGLCQAPGTGASTGPTEPPTPRPTPRPTAAPACTDERSTCKTYKEKGWCEKSWIKKRCCASCAGETPAPTLPTPAPPTPVPPTPVPPTPPPPTSAPTTPAPTSCENKKSYCDSWADPAGKDYCRHMKRFMEDNCCLACSRRGSAGPAPTKPTPTPAPTPPPTEPACKPGGLCSTYKTMGWCGKWASWMGRICCPHFCDDEESLIQSMGCLVASGGGGCTFNTECEEQTKVQFGCARADGDASMMTLSLPSNHEHDMSGECNSCVLERVYPA